MERIAPLAKILAEANGIDWRHLQGTGEGGTIVEQDILNYLTRVMSGEEEPPSTPVDAPPPEWTGTELPPGAGLFGAGMPSADMLSSVGVDSDLAALVGQPPATPPAPPASAPAADDLEFELEDEQGDAVPLAAQPEPVPPVVEPVMPAAVLTSPEARAEERLLPGRHEAVPAPQLVEPAPAPAAATPPAAGRMGGLGSLLSRLYHPGTPRAEPEATPALPVQPTPAPEVPAPAPAAQATPVEAPVTEPPVVPAPVAEAPAPVDVTPPSAVPVEETAPVLPVVEAVIGEEAMIGEGEKEQFTVPVTQPEPQAEAAAPVMEPEVEASAPVAAPLPAAERPREAVWFGAYLRRDVNLAPATELRRQLVAALGQDMPLALLVARAAQRHAGSLGLGSVALHDPNGQDARVVEPGSLRSALGALETQHVGTPDLLVTDAGALDLDDLHLPHTVTLSVGRVQEGRAALSLQGDVDATRAARFLADVAGTLEEPIILVI